MSTILLIQEIFWMDVVKLWTGVVVAIVAIQALVGSLVISVACSPSQALQGRDHTDCSGSVGLVFVLRGGAVGPPPSRTGKDSASDICHLFRRADGFLLASPKSCSKASC